MFHVCSSGTLAESISAMSDLGAREILASLDEFRTVPSPVAVGETLRKNGEKFSDMSRVPSSADSDLVLL